MPELPEVETVLTGMKEFLLGQTIRDVKIFSPKLRNIIPKNLRKGRCKSKGFSDVPSGKIYAVDS
jgi:formamidopyrimidine-DNA glycosylase